MRSCVCRVSPVPQASLWPSASPAATLDDWLIAVRLVMSAGRVMAAECGAAVVPPVVREGRTRNRDQAGGSEPHECRPSAIAYAVSSTGSNSTDATADVGCPVTVWAARASGTRSMDPS